LKFEARDPDFENKVRGSYARQKFMADLGAIMDVVEPGQIEIILPVRKDLTQQHGFVHGGVVSTILDSACGYAALTLLPKTRSVLAIEFKVNFLSPGVGDRLIARGHVVRAGQTINVCHGEAFALKDGKEKLVATMTATIMTISNPDLAE